MELHHPPQRLTTPFEALIILRFLSVDHLKPRVTHPHLDCEYTNLFYACCQCNSLKQAVSLPLHPSEAGWAQHLQMRDDGVLQALSRSGEELIEVCRLNRAALVEGRRDILETVAMLNAANNDKTRARLHRLLGYPANLPNLARLRPPGGNGRPQGIAESFYERRERGDLPEMLGQS